MENDTMANTVDDEVAKLRRDFEELRTDVRSLMDTMKDSGAQRGREAWDRARRAGESLQEEVEELRQQAERKIGAYPVTSVLSSFGLGFLIGLFLDRRR
jgi:ElaB/YqjD/DUF883 family membrane-anchored ribosome-binding protein